MRIVFLLHVGLHMVSPLLVIKKTPVINSTSAVKVYKQQALQRMLYGTEVSQLCSKSIKILENGHWLIAKHIQGLKPQTSNIAVLMSVGLTSIETEIQSGQLMFFSRILMLDPSNIYIYIYKRVARIRFIQAVYGNIEGEQGPVNQVVEIARKKGILNSFIDVLMNGCSLYESQWKNLVKEIWQDTLGVNMWVLWGYGHLYKKHAWSIHRYMAMVDI